MCLRTLIAIFLIIYNFQIIIGESFASFWIVYWIGGLTEVLPHALLCFFGVICTTIAFFRLRQNKPDFLLPVGVLGMLLGLFLFFIRDERNYNIGTFKDPVSLTLFIFSTLLGLGLLISFFIISPKYSK